MINVNVFKSVILTHFLRSIKSRKYTFLRLLDQVLTPKNSTARIQPWLDGTFLQTRLQYLTFKYAVANI